MTTPRTAVRFNYRVAGVVLHDGHVLLHQAAHDDFWALPGGRPELMEPTAVALAREMREELGVTAAVGRLIWVVENFFGMDGGQVNEVCFYFACQLPDDCAYLDPNREFLGIEPTPVLRFRWFPVAELEGVRLFPSFLRTELRQPPPVTTHRVHTDVDELITQPISPATPAT